MSLVSFSHAQGWRDFSIDHGKQFEAADFVGIVAVTETAETDKSKTLKKGGFPFREVRLKVKVLSSFKGEITENFELSIYRLPTRQEVMAGGLSRKVYRSMLLTQYDGEDDSPAWVEKEDRLLVYLSFADGKYTPVSGDLESSRSLLRIERAEKIETLPRNRKAEQDGADQPATAPESKPEGDSEPQRGSEGRSK
ncbi:MAG: hypothetical protein KJO21_11755 [Verrucomicrobiae bacterium]|nr:hypothetical protein [Verrucomicrobiae bacterium]